MSEMHQDTVGIAVSSELKQSAVLWLASRSYPQGDDKVDSCGRGSWWMETLKVGVMLQSGLTLCLHRAGFYIGS